ncbi:maleylpyruvate isomerase family mycothiol-dependent enzyme [Nocardia amamiensis]|uniref:Maleylpyruvate isomerase family mycothiol-dependent enzyme n=1 Tax=Nocardia amamiensis TaxID=404578 RepID=A0ABS0CKG8_9NOCA|nr:maleylpyruvate isomerase family mycothiol-dependent enzyme [Nocardia amamiensis]MBF6297115.1 maleylpyruvate isomerase family mycothiol-dependent enzyme [Nocardia amamiensis]
MDTKALARAERAEFADLIAELSDDQWQAQSLCAPWRVRDVAAHVISYGQLTPARFAARLARGQLLDRVNALGVAAYAERTPRQLSELVRADLDPSGLTAWFGGRVALVEAMIHQQDIRRPLGLPRVIPSQRMRVALDFTRYAPLIRGAWRTRGVRLVATDLAWTHGVGPEVRGTAEALLMVMAGRRAALADVAGAGRSRLAHLLVR